MYFIIYSPVAIQKKFPSSARSVPIDSKRIGQISLIRNFHIGKRYLPSVRKPPRVFLLETSFEFEENYFHSLGFLPEFSEIFKNIEKSFQFTSNFHEYRSTFSKDYIKYNDTSNLVKIYVSYKVIFNC